MTSTPTLTDDLDQEGLYCGCCGNEIGRSTRTDPDWCKRCKPHIRHYPRVPPWLRTYFAQHREDCPYQVGAND